MKSELGWKIGHFLTTRIKPVFDCHNLKVLKMTSLVYANLFHIVLWKAGVRRPFIVDIMGEKCEISTEEDFLTVSHRMRLSSTGFDYQVCSGSNKIGFSYNDRIVVLNFEHMAIFDLLSLVEKFAGIDDKYNSVKVKDRDVVDIGSNIGDTAILYALQGARRIISLEPNPAFYTLALENVKSNGLENVILINGAAGKSSFATVDEVATKRIGLPFIKVKDGVKIRIRNIDEIVDEFDLKDAILKVVCVGCERDLFQFSSDACIRRFSQILIVCICDDGYLRNRLKSLGYRATVLSKDFVINPFMNPGNLKVVSIVATRQS